MNNITKAIMTFLIPLVLLLLHSFYYYPFFVDDAFISLRYSDRLLSGGGLTWNDGERVEGYSNFLWVILVAKLGYMGFDLVSAGRLVCLLSAIMTLAAFVYYQQKYMQDRFLPLFWGGTAFALSAPVAIWAVGGLEGTLTMALLAWAFVLAMELLKKPDMKCATIVGVLLGFVCLTRPEGAFFTVVIVAATFLFAEYSRKKTIPALIILGAIPFVFFCGQVAFRLFYYNDWMPNTYYAKLTPLTFSRTVNGLLYTIKGSALFLPLFLIMFLHTNSFAKQESSTKKRIQFCALIIAVWLLMVFYAGGDMEPGYRHFLPIVPLIILVFIESIRIAYSSGSINKTHIFCGYLLACFIWLQFTFEETKLAKQELWEWEMKELGTWLNKYYKDEQPLIAVSNAGAIPYYSKLPSIDMFGLNDHYLAHNPSPLLGHGLLGHELFNAEYILKRKPDMVIFFSGKKEIAICASLTQDPLFLQLYKTVDIQLPSYTATVWVRKDSKKLTRLNSIPSMHW